MKDIIEENFQQVFDFFKLSLSKDNYEESKNELHSRIASDFSLRKESAGILIDDEIIETNLGNVLLNLYLLRPFVGSSIKFEKDDLYLSNKLSQGDLEGYFNKVLKKFQTASEREEIDFDYVRQEIADVLDEMNQASVKFNSLYGHSISFHDFLDTAAEYPDSKDIFYPVIPDGLQFDELEKMFKDKGKQITDFYLKHPTSELFPFVAAKTGLNTKQLTQAISFVGLKPAMDGTVIPYPIKDNFLVGLKSIDQYFVNCCGTRLALATNNLYTRKSGYLTRKLSLLTMDTFHDDDLEDCGTKHFVVYSIENEKKLKMAANRHYYEIDQESGKKLSDELKTVDSSDKSLIGKKIGMRSPVTCCGKHICRTCYGSYLSEINKKLNSGLAGTLRITEPLTQTLLSAKHLLTTNSEKIDWPEEFLDYFVINMDNVYFGDMDVSISFKIPDENEDYDQDEEMYKISEFTIIPDDRKSFVFQPTVPFFINPKYISEEAIEDSEDGFITISSKTGQDDLLEDDDFVFHFQPKNNELISSLLRIVDLIETRDHLGVQEISGFVNKFADLLIENGMDYIQSVHAEMIASRLIVDEITNKKPDFSQEVLNPYTINRVTKSVLDGPIAISLAFERLNDQFADLKTYEKDEESLLDCLFK